MLRHITRETEMLLNARHKLGLSQQQVASFIGVPIRQYQRYEYGETEIRHINIRAGLLLCALLELDPVNLVFGGIEALDEMKKQGQMPLKGRAHGALEKQGQMPLKDRAHGALEKQGQTPLKGRAHGALEKQGDKPLPLKARVHGKRPRKKMVGGE